MNTKYLFAGLILSTVLTLSCADSTRDSASAVNQTVIASNRLNEKSGTAKTSAVELVKSFKEDKAKASESHLGKVIIVDGIAAEVNEQTENKPYIVLKTNDATDNIEVYLKNPDPNKLKTVAKDLRIFVKGNCELKSDKVVIRDASVVAVQKVS